MQHKNTVKDWDSDTIVLRGWRIGSVCLAVLRKLRRIVGELCTTRHWLRWLHSNITSQPSITQINNNNNYLRCNNIHFTSCKHHRTEVRYRCAISSFADCYQLNWYGQFGMISTSHLVLILDAILWHELWFWFISVLLRYTVCRLHVVLFSQLLKNFSSNSAYTRIRYTNHPTMLEMYPCCWRSDEHWSTLTIAGSCVTAVCCRDVAFGGSQTWRSFMSLPRKMMYSKTSSRGGTGWSVGLSSVPNDLTATTRCTLPSQLQR